MEPAGLDQDWDLEVTGNLLVNGPPPGLGIAVLTICPDFNPGSLGDDISVRRSSIDCAALLCWHEWNRSVRMFIDRLSRSNDIAAIKFSVSRIHTTGRTSS